MSSLSHELRVGLSEYSLFLLQGGMARPALASGEEKQVGDGAELADCYDFLSGVQRPSTDVVWTSSAEGLHVKLFIWGEDRVG